MVYYNTLTDFVFSATTVNERLTKIRQILSALRDQQLAMALNGNKTSMSEYQLDDGQTRIKTVYRDPNEIASAILTLEQAEQRYMNIGLGRVTRLVDENNLKLR